MQDAAPVEIQDAVATSSEIPAQKVFGTSRW